MTNAADFLPSELGLEGLREAVEGCRGCELWACASRAVPGEGPPDAQVMLVGEQPGNEEDLTGRPFVGPAGRLLDRALAEVGLDRSEVYLTNVVKHFRSEPRGKRRIHKKPGDEHIEACRPWLEAEIAMVRPAVLVCLGATAAKALLGPEFRVSRERGAFVPSPLAPHVIATVHPSSVLRAPDEGRRRDAYARFVRDLGHVADRVRGLSELG
ncbi:MAG: UdgX family uracil-DNA binding protein [Pseudomonadota bacterium]|nr:UdgX family uracil-DNA binding protein [Pseudomonadota bacterium]